MADPELSSNGSFEGHRNPDAERDADHYGPGAGGKKRKVPAFAPSGRNEDEDPSYPSSTKPQPQLFPLRYRSPRSKAATACSFRKALFLRRKAALITLYIDAQNAVIGGSAKLGPNGKSPLMDVPSFEKLMPSLEDLGMGDWPPDRPGWRTNWTEENAEQGNGNGTALGRVKTLEQWRTKFDQRQKEEKARKQLVRGGWFPEGSFEYERENAGAALVIWAVGMCADGSVFGDASEGKGPCGVTQARRRPEGHCAHCQAPAQGYKRLDQRGQAASEDAADDDVDECGEEGRCAGQGGCPAQLCPAESDRIKGERSGQQRQDQDEEEEEEAQCAGQSGQPAPRRQL